MNELQELRIEKMPFREFIRGQTLDFIMYLSKNISPNRFRDWTPTAQLRKLHNPTKEGFIANLDVTWADLEYTALRIRYLGDTSKWPLGPVEFDVVLTTPLGHKVRTFPVRFTIVPEVTRYDKDGAPCEDAKEIELTVKDGFILWRRKGEIWQILIPLAELKGADGKDGHTPVLEWVGDRISIDGVLGPPLTGPKGEQGPPGPPGRDGRDGEPGKGVVPWTQVEPPPSFYARPGEIIFTSDGRIYYVNPDGNPEFYGDLKGKDGKDAKDIEFDIDGDYVKWRREGEEWRNLISLKELEERYGKEIVLTASPTHILWKYITDETWKELVPLEELKGEKGEKGDKGDKGDPGEDGTKWHLGEAAPSGSLGKVGDFYLVSTTGDYYEKTDPLTWTLRGNLKGPKGDKGDPGGGGGGSGIVGIATYQYNESTDEYDLVDFRGNVDFPSTVFFFEVWWMLAFEKPLEYLPYFVIEVPEPRGLEAWLIQKEYEDENGILFYFRSYDPGRDPRDLSERPETFRVIVFRGPE